MTETKSIKILNNLNNWEGITIDMCFSYLYDLRNAVATSDIQLAWVIPELSLDLKYL